jgi:hypothetical protein
MAAITATGTSNTDSSANKNDQFPPALARLRDDPVDGDGLHLLEQAHPDRPAFYVVRVPRCRVSPRASFPPASRRRSCLRLGVSTTSSSRGLSPPIDRPCRAYSRRRLRRRAGFGHVLPLRSRRAGPAGLPVSVGSIRRIRKLARAAKAPLQASGACRVRTATRDALPLRPWIPLSAPEDAAGYNPV